MKLNKYQRMTAPSDDSMDEFIDSLPIIGIMVAPIYSCSFWYDNYNVRIRYFLNLLKFGDGEHLPRIVTNIV